MTETVYLNGKFIAKENAKISVLDRGFLFADGVYEVIPAYHSVPFRLNEHLQRLNYCLLQLSITNPYTNQQWQQLISQLIDKNGGGHLSIYVQVTRGVSTQRDHILTKGTPPTVLIMTNELGIETQTLTTATATLLEDIRWQHCDIKSIALLGNILLRNKAAEQGYDEAILQRDGLVTEGSTSNVFMVTDGKIYTPPKNQFILGGITRDLIIEIAESNGYEVHEQSITSTQLLTCDEVWISSSSREISPIVAIDGKIVGSGQPGPIAAKLFDKFQAFKQSLVK